MMVRHVGALVGVVYVLERDTSCRGGTFPTLHHSRFGDFSSSVPAI